MRHSSGAVGAVIVTHDDVEGAVRCATSLGLDPAAVVIVANACTAPNAGTWRCVSPDQPQGYGANVNLGVKQLPRDLKWLLLLNDDVVFEPETIPALMHATSGRPSVGAISPGLLGPDGRPQAVGFRFPSVRTEFASYLLGPEVLRKMLRRGAVTVTGSGVTYHDWVLGAALLVRGRAFAEAGGYEESYFMYSEDTELGLALQRGGWRSAVLHQVSVLHLGGQSTPEAMWSDQMSASRRLYLRRHWSRLRRLVLEVGWCAAMVWNATYVVASMLVSPARHEARLRDFRAQVRTRPWHSW